MIIDRDVFNTAHSFGLDPNLLQAVVNAEGDILKAVQCSLPKTENRAEALVITARSAVHAMSDFLKSNHGQDFVNFWQQRWAPQGASNDPTNLNKNWARNVGVLWGVSV